MTRKLSKKGGCFINDKISLYQRFGLVPDRWLPWAFHFNRWAPFFKERRGGRYFWMIQKLNVKMKRSKKEWGSNYVASIVTYCMLTYCIQGDIINWVNNMNIVKVFASNLKYYRNKLGVSQEQFADKAGLHRTYISAIECGKRSISLDNIQKIAEALEIETYLLFVDDCDKKDRKKAGGK